MVYEGKEGLQYVYYIRRKKGAGLIFFGAGCRFPSVVVSVHMRTETEFDLFVMDFESDSDFETKLTCIEY
ncbi:hypothetical protein Ahy_A04g017257 isoform D [Arachis hypogaea]|uniref:Uncharacterized protein n=1 Tax=Arachis hypogaea TaxID=3818 RepID=A0A445DAH6_ARAHY|nr:hypothetical protein Ahy_A04g017257 isoform D [Arachis hypogaea]